MDLWVEKYRPRQFKDLVSQDCIIQTIETMIKNDSLPHMLFYGPPGSGKTSTAHILSSHFADILEVSTLSL
jgi:replication-associated recombination protein RarA